MPATNYVFDERTVFLARMETTYGVDPGDPYTAIPVYDAFNIIQPSIGITEVNRAKDSLAPEPPLVNAPTNNLRATTFVYGAGISNVTPPWCLLLEAAGFQRSVVAGTALAAPTVAAGGAGDIPNGTYDYVITRIATTGNETPRSTKVTVTITGGPKQVNITAIPAGGTGTRTRIYRSRVGGGPPFYLVDEIDGPSTSYTDNTIDGMLDQTRLAPASAGEHVAYVPVNQDWASLFCRAFLDGHQRVSRGTRGGFTGQWRAGEPMSMQWDMVGLYDPPSNDTAVANPVGTCIGPGNPPRAESVDAKLFVRHPDSTFLEDLGSGSPGGDIGDSIPLVIKSMTLNLGRTATPRTDANSDSSIIEIGLHRRMATRLSLVVEVPKPYTWAPEEDMLRSCNFGFRFHITPRTAPTHRRIEFSLPNIYLSREPRLTREDDGIRCFDLEFVPNDLFSCTDSLRIRQF